MSPASRLSEKDFEYRLEAAPELFLGISGRGGIGKKFPVPGEPEFSDDFAGAETDGASLDLDLGTVDEEAVATVHI